MKMYTIGIVFIVVIFLITVSKYVTKASQNEKRIPGPKPIFLFGNVLDFATSTDKFLSKMMEYIDSYGSIIKVHLSFSRSMIFTTDYELTEYILTSTTILEKSFVYDSLKNWLGLGLLTSTGVIWKHHRKMITPSFHFSILVQFLKIFESVGNNFIDKLDKLVGKPSVDIYPLVSLCTLDIICEAAMGTSVGALNDGESEYVRSVKKMCRIVTDRVFTPLHRYLYPLTPNYFMERKALRVIHAYTDSVINNKIRNKSIATTMDEDNVGAKKKAAFLDLLLESTLNDQHLTRSEIREEVDTFMFEGHDTTASAITFALYSLAINADIQQKVIDEQRTIFGSDRKRITTNEDIQNMKYLELVIKETLRMYPSVPLISRKLNKDIDWDGLKFRNGEAVTIFIFGIHRNAKYFPNPEKFIPERFEEYNGKPFSYVPFSAGPRNCIGQRFAIMEMKSTISKVIRHFELHPAKPEHVLKLAPETVLLSKNGVRISMERRKWE